MPISPHVRHPKTVIAPKSRLDHPHAIYAGTNWSLAVGIWDNKRAMLIRWNDDPAKPLGNPVSRANPTWFVLPEAFHDEALKIVDCKTPDRAAKARDWLKNNGPDRWPYDPDEFPECPD